MITAANIRPFLATGNTVTIAATGSSSTTSLGTTGLRGGNVEMPLTIRVYNAGPDIAWIKPGVAATTAAKTADTAIPVPAGNTEVFWYPADATHLAVIAQTSSATVYVTPGQGS